jgi:hypothetical protein
VIAAIISSLQSGTMSWILRMRLTTSALVVIGFALGSCSRVPHHVASPGVLGSRPVVLTLKENTKYRLICIFYGERLKGENGVTDTDLIEYVTIRDQRDGSEVRYVPTDAISLIESLGFFTNVWSPDEELLVLPLGRFEGFSITRSAEVMQRLSTGRFNDFVRVELDNGVRLWHEFGNWEGPASFVFNAGLSGQHVRFTYYLSDHALTGDEDVGIGVNSQGTLPIRPPKSDSSGSMSSRRA